MKVHIIREPATEEQVRGMLEVFGTFIRLAVDVERVWRPWCVVCLRENGND